MLSIGAMGHGQGAYYVGLAREDYYLVGGEPPGQWHGRGAAALGLSGTVEGKRCPAAGRVPPEIGAGLSRTRGRGHQPGWDLTFSAPNRSRCSGARPRRSCGSRSRTRTHAAVRTALDDLDDTAAFTRRGKGGREREPAHLMIATFERGSQPGPGPAAPQPHPGLEHLRPRDGNTRTIVSKHFYQAKMTPAPCTVRSSPTNSKRVRGWACGATRGTRLSGRSFPAAHQGVLPTRAQRCEKNSSQRVVQRGGGPPKATLQPASKGDTPARAVVRAVGGDRERLRVEADRGRGAARPAPPRRPEEELPVALTRTATERATEQQSWFTEEQFVRLLAEEAPARGLEAEAVRAGATAHLARARKSSAWGARSGGAGYTTREMMRLEPRSSRPWTAARSSETAGSYRASVLSNVIALARGSPGSRQTPFATWQESRRAGPGGVRHGGDRQDDLPDRRPPGLGAGRVHCPLRGAGRQGREGAANGNEDSEHDVPHPVSRTWRTGGCGSRKRSILVVDEAGMVGTRIMQRLVEATERRGARLVLVGDDGQLQSIEADLPFAEIRRRLGATELTEIYRQRGDVGPGSGSGFCRRGGVPRSSGVCGAGPLDGL